jgi:hypothetical protein
MSVLDRTTWQAGAGISGTILAGHGPSRLARCGTGRNRSDSPICRIKSAACPSTITPGRQRTGWKWSPIRGCSRRSAEEYGDTDVGPKKHGR